MPQSSVPPVIFSGSLGGPSAASAGRAKAVAPSAVTVATAAATDI
ncbi:hypothetical protein [Streptomyces sp. NBC_01500]|nr:hypothetical protein [Streptomyces sp. NBC_01500]MCX4551459.1 hypothetical protein [Streptomyces sp. NBC_01500]